MNMASPLAGAPAVWGGIECTIARLRNRTRDQLAETGHRDRLHDLDLVASLGVRTLRYPVLWESVSPKTPDRARWMWHDARLGRLRDLGITTIAGLVHHGSGPAYTDLLDREFPEKLARHARAVAMRYPWLESFTPVNEPLTTARFSGLYGFWYPHRRDVPSCLRMLVNQCRGVVLAMQAIREVTPTARLVQTEDLGKTFSTPLLAYQAEYENERRWLTFDLLTGRVTSDHPLYEHLLENGIGAEELAFFADASCVPDVIGINHYLTSERFLDHRRTRAKGHRTGSNGRHRYADLEAIRMGLPEGATGPEARLREAWDRYGLPMAVTEVHHGCSRDEQLRWLAEVWEAAAHLRQSGADVRAVTVWALFGAMDWNSLLTRRAGHYEAGAFDIRSTPPRLTALGAATQQLVQTGSFDHPVLATPGWWRRDERLYRPAIGKVAELHVASRRPLLVIGATGDFGRVLSRSCSHRGLASTFLPSGDLDVRDEGGAAEMIDRLRPWAVLNAAGMAAFEVAPNGLEVWVRAADAVLAEACAQRGLPFLSFWRQGGLSTAAAGEGTGVASFPSTALVARIGPTFGPLDRDNFILCALREMASGHPYLASTQRRVSPSYTPDLVHAALDLLIDGERGVWQLSNGGASWFDLARRIAEVGGLDPSLVQPDLDAPEAGVAGGGGAAGSVMPSLESALQRYFREGEIPSRRETDVMAAE
jgi:dTDP-4-dehydrorhamnose reductase